MRLELEIYKTNEDCWLSLFTCITTNRDFHLESFHLVFLGCPFRWGRLRNCHVFKPLVKHMRHRYGKIFVAVTCFSVLMQFRGGGHSRRRGWCSLRPPPARPPTPRTWRAAASLEPPPGSKEMSPWADEPARKLTLTFRKYSFSSGSCPLTYPSDSESE